ncbi:ABC transporter G family-like protein [Hapsidospora chrysogenum ATCC 11550]|uniref:ABC transporter G family-like protein n=1 Tax=Hapsidospora chrysogenum (strain ATCC 11550 / CBS 779.69 / DSM 880 / IAM 14645 / JCM 23072 / IMI 49137) TaxID=857340 RepID=A0A086T1G9_HAPC1|nr:ABC transporter G family-like protein [Hapsidospora chrysogenum ATCC 11550]
MAKQQTEKDRRLGVTWHDLNVKGTGPDAAVHENVGSQFNIPARLKESRGTRKPLLRTIVDNSHGCVKPGEMLLVLGRPGAGCTSLLKILANRRLGYAQVTGEVRYGSMTANDAALYRGQIVMNTEEELFFPTLTVQQTIDFATRMKVPHQLPSDITSADEFRQTHRDFLLRSMGIEHTRDTKVGNEFVRGVSGGERKRVSIIETMATRGSVFCWDNPTRGLDASTALEYVRCVRAMTDALGLSSIMTLYQAGNGIYDLFDKVLILDEGKQTFYGPARRAKPFMEELGFLYTDGANIADYLTGVTVPTERRIRPGMENRYPRNADQLRSSYEATELKRTMALEYDYPNSAEAADATKDFQEAVYAEKDPGLSKTSPLTVSFYTQVRSAVIRQYQLLRGDKVTFLIPQGLNFVQALISGSLFYNAPDDSSGLPFKAGSLFFAILLNSLLAMSEVTSSFAARPVLAKHRGFALYHPAAFCFAQIAADIPLVLMQVTLFALPVYWMTGLKPTGEAFMTYWVTTITVTMCMTALFRAIGAAFSSFDAASKVSGFLMSALIMYTGFLIPKPSMHPWLAWIFWINPLAYGYEAVLSNELHGQLIPCVGRNLVPNGPGYSNSEFQACTGIRGAPMGASVITGDQYLQGLSYSHAHVWRNFGIVWAWWVLFVVLTVYFTSNWSQVSGNSGYSVIPREKADRTKHLAVDEEARPGLDLHDSSHPSGTSPVDGEKGGGPASSSSEMDAQLTRNTSIFTWKGLSYTVKTPSGDRVLLDNVQGWVKPGMLGALMGSSGAGKTTLLDVLAQRKTEGTIKGSILVDGRDLPVSFQRSAGYCEQLDVHEPLSTVREALEFSALLRQSRDTPVEKKLKYVDTIIDLLEMHDIENTLIGTTAAGLSVEQRKRLTIGVELVSKPSILIFLDEPTSGLDGQAAFNIVRFLRKLADVGQAVLVTIHQPSASLFAQFDTLLLLAKGGKTASTACLYAERDVYFGDIGHDGATVKEYFGRNGAPCPQNANPAEHMIDVVSGSSISAGRDWNEVWLASPEYAAMTQELDHIIRDAASKPPGTLDDGHEFATPIWTQLKLVTNRNNVSLWRNTGYINNKFMLHIFSGLLNGFTFWRIGNSVADLQLRLFTIFNFIFVAPGVIAQLQPLFLERRDIYEAREKKSKMYHWSAFTTGLIVSELPYLVLCAIVYYVTWYYTVGFPSGSDKAGAIFFVMLMYEFIYTGIGQAIAAYAPNAVFAILVNPLVIGILVFFCGVYVPYSQIQEVWRYWLYYLNPFSYLMGSMLVFSTFDAPVHCGRDEFAVFDAPDGQTCGEYLADYMQGLGSRTNLLNPNDTQHCRVCQYRTGSDYLYTMDLKDYYYGWRDAAIVALFAISSYACVYALMKLRTKESKKAES